MWNFLLQSILITSSSYNKTLISHVFTVSCCRSVESNSSNNLKICVYTHFQNYWFICSYKSIVDNTAINATLFEQLYDIHVHHQLFCFQTDNTIKFWGVKRINTGPSWWKFQWIPVFIYSMNYCAFSSCKPDFDVHMWHACSIIKPFDWLSLQTRLLYLHILDSRTKQFYM